MLTREDIEVSRTIPKLRQRFDEWIERLEKKELVLKKGYVKKFIEEVRLALIYLEHRYLDCSDFVYTPSMGNQRYDGILKDPCGNILEYIECTYAIDGQLDHHRRKAFVENRTVSWNTTPSGYKRGQKWENSYSFPIMAVNVEEMIKATVDEIRTRISQKAKKEYSKGTILIVAFESTAPKRYYDMIINSARIQKSADAGSFSAIWVVSYMRGKERAESIYEAATSGSST